MEIQRKRGKYVGISGERIRCFTLTLSLYASNSLGDATTNRIVVLPKEVEVSSASVAVAATVANQTLLV
jgi:hypothetical protein